MLSCFLHSAFILQEVTTSLIPSADWRANHLRYIRKVSFQPSSPYMNHESMQAPLLQVVQTCIWSVTDNIIRDADRFCPVLHLLWESLRREDTPVLFDGCRKAFKSDSKVALLVRVSPWVCNLQHNAVVIKAQHWISGKIVEHVINNISPLRVANNRNFDVWTLFDSCSDDSLEVLPAGCPRLKVPGG